MFPLVLMSIEEKQGDWIIDLEGVTWNNSFAELLHSTYQLILEAVRHSDHLTVDEEAHIKLHLIRSNLDTIL